MAHFALLIDSMPWAEFPSYSAANPGWGDDILTLLGPGGGGGNITGRKYPMTPAFKILLEYPHFSLSEWLLVPINPSPLNYALINGMLYYSPTRS